jgi:clan AA aspartic protease (TIGR02281 family)
MQCADHPDRDSINACAKCLRFVCETCQGKRRVDLCARCERRRTLWVRLGSVALLLGLGTLAAALARNPLLLKDAFELAWPATYGPARFTVVRLKRALRREPCDHTGIIKLIQALRSAGALPEAIETGEKFETRCEAFSELSEQKFEAYQRASEWKKAMTELEHLIEQHPVDYNYWGRRGLLWEKVGEFTLAASDYEQAITLDPFLSDVPINLAQIYERQGRYCDAALRLTNLLAYYRNFANAGEIQTHAGQLFEQGRCSHYTRGGETVLKFPPSAPTIDVVAQLNHHSIPLTIDASASYVTLSEEAAAKAGVYYLDGTPILFSSPGGVLHGILTTADSIRVQNLEATQVPVVVIPETSNAKGILGLSFLSRFEHDVDRRRGRLTLKTLRPRVKTSE